MVRKPWLVQVELVEGCNRLCWFCGLTSIRDRPGQDIRYMSWEVVDAITQGVHELCPTSRIEFAMHGEPLLHPELHDIIAEFRFRLPAAQLQLTTNGKVLLGDMSESLRWLFIAGIDIVVLDTYYPERDRLRQEAFVLDNVDVWDFYEDEDVPSPWYNHHRTVNHTVILMDDISVVSGKKRTRQLNNQGGNAGDGSLLRLNKVCTLPFREISIHRDGDVCICCMDVGHEYVCGNVLHMGLGEIWYGSGFEAARRVLYQRQRSFSPCARCDASVGGRVGLLPEYPPNEPCDVAVIDAVICNSDYRNEFDRIYMGGMQC